MMTGSKGTLTYEAGQLRGHKWEQVDAMLALVAEHRPDAIAYEDFSLRVGLHRGAASRRETLDPVRITEAFIYAMYREQHRGPWWVQWASDSAYRVQSSADAKGFATDERLRRWGTYVTGDHARDAMRHAMLTLAKTRGEREAVRVVLAFDPGGTTGWAVVRRSHQGQSS